MSQQPADVPSSQLPLRRRVAFTLIALVGVLLFCVLFVESALRMRGPMRVHGSTVAHPTLHHSHAPLTSMLFGIPGGEYEPVLLSFDADGARIDPDSAPPNPPQLPYRIAVVGDSFVEAAELPWAQTFTGMLAARFPQTTQVRNFGVASYSPVLSLLQWRQIIAPWHPTHVIYVSYENDFGGLENSYSDASYLQSAEYSASGQQLLAIRPQHSWLRRVADRSYLRWEIMKGWAALKQHLQRTNQLQTAPPLQHPHCPVIEAPSTANLLTLRREVESTGALFFHTAIPCKSRHLAAEVSQQSLDSAFAAQLRKWSTSQGISFIDLDPAFAAAAQQGRHLFFQRDIHLNAQGHIVVFQQIIARLAPTLSNPSPTAP